MPRSSVITMLTFAAVLSACAAPPKENQDLLPRDYRNEIKLLLQKELDDPTNIREAGITEPALNPALSIKRYYSCVKYNAREMMTKRYKGVVTKVAVFYDGHLNQMIEAPADMCAAAPYKPFPEIEKMCLGVKCD